MVTFSEEQWAYICGPDSGFSFDWGRIALNAYDAAMAAGGLEERDGSFFRDVVLHAARHGAGLPHLAGYAAMMGRRDLFDRLTSQMNVVTPYDAYTFCMEWMRGGHYEQVPEIIMKWDVTGDDLNTILLELAREGEQDIFVSIYTLAGSREASDRWRERDFPPWTPDWARFADAAAENGNTGLFWWMVGASGGTVDGLGRYAQKAENEGHYELAREISARMRRHRPWYRRWPGQA